MPRMEGGASDEVAVTPDGRVTKRVLREGAGEKPRAGDTVTLHYVGWAVKDDVRKQFDATRERGAEFSFVLLREATVLGLENAVCTMQPGERSVVKMSPQYAYGASSTESASFHGLGKSIPAGSSLEFDLELMHVATPQELAQADEAKEKPLEERIVMAEEMRLRGNALFKEGKLQAAAEVYKATIPMLRLVKATDEEQRIRGKALVPLCLNLAQCLIDMELYREAEGYIDTALADDPDNAKGLFRMAVVDFKLRNNDDALRFAVAAQKQQDSKQIRLLLTQIKSAIAQENQSAQKSYKNIFASDKPLYTEKHTAAELKSEEAKKEEAKFDNCNVCGARMLRSDLPKHVVSAHASVLDETNEKARAKFEPVEYWK